MKKISGLLAALLVLVLTTCNFSAGSKKNLVTGLSYNYTGFSIDDVLLVGPDNTSLSSNEIELNTKIAVVAQALGNYELKNEKAFPGLMLKVTDKQGNTILEEADLFAASEGFSPSDAAFIRGTLTVGSPMKTGETYHVKMRVWDKIKPENELTAEVDIAVK